MRGSAISTILGVLVLFFFEKDIRHVVINELVGENRSIPGTDHVQTNVLFQLLWSFAD